MKTAGILAISLVFLAGCATTKPAPRVVYRDVNIAVPVYCVRQDQIPPEPPLVAGQLVGNAAADIGVISISTIELRKAFRLARALLTGCVKPEGD